jgi:hypothetical protein
VAARHFPPINFYGRRLIEVVEVVDVTGPIDGFLDDPPFRYQTDKS